MITAIDINDRNKDWKKKAKKSQLTFLTIASQLSIDQTSTVDKKNQRNWKAFPFQQHFCWIFLFNKKKSLLLESEYQTEFKFTSKPHLNFYNIFIVIDFFIIITERQRCVRERQVNWIHSTDGNFDQCPVKIKK